MDDVAAAELKVIERDIHRDGIFERIVPPRASLLMRGDEVELAAAAAIERHEHTERRAIIERRVLAVDGNRPARLIPDERRNLGLRERVGDDGQEDCGGRCNP